MRFRRVGARAFLRLDDPRFEKMPIFGDCGAFTYHQDEVPPYTPEDMAEFYADGGFTHGCSVDHIIFDFDRNLAGMDGGTDETRRRFDITLENAAPFCRQSPHLNSFTPLGVIQGWSPGSMAEAAARLGRHGIRLPGARRHRSAEGAADQACLSAIRGDDTRRRRLHILGFAKANEIESLRRLASPASTRRRR